MLAGCGPFSAFALEAEGTSGPLANERLRLGRGAP